MNKLILPILGLLLCVAVMAEDVNAEVAILDMSEDGNAYAMVECAGDMGWNEKESANEETTYYVVPEWTGQKLAPGIGTVYGPTGKETYYNQDMSTLISWARDAGYDAETYPYWIREDCCKMMGKYIMCAADLNHFPRYSLVESSLGTCIVVDTGDFVYWDEGWNWLDLAVTW